MPNGIDDIFINMDDLIDFYEEGFEGQLLFRVPETVVDRMELQPFVRDFIVTDLGWFPDVSKHRVERNHGLEQEVLIVIESGLGWVKWGDNTSTLEAGQALWIPAGCPHSYGSQLGRSWSLSWFHFEGRGARELIDFTGLSPWANAISPHVTKDIRDIFRQSFMSVQQGFSNMTLLELSKSLIQILSLIVSNPKGSPSKKRNHPIERVISHMKSNLHLNLVLLDLAKLSGLSVPQFSQRFKAHTGVSPMVYFTELRMQKAGNLLDETHEPITQVATQMGFADPLYFSRQFKKCTGLSPRAYRQRN